MTSSRAHLAILACLLLLAMALRLIGLRFGLPAVYNPDEIAITSRALAFAKGDLNPHNFLYPTFYFYVLFAWLGLSFVVSWLTGAVASLAAFQTQFFVNPTNIYFAGRLFGALCGTLTVGLVYLLGRNVFLPLPASRGQGRGEGGTTASRGEGRDEGPSTVGLMAALFLAVAPGHVRDSHYVKHDVPATLAIVVAQLTILRVLRSPMSTSTYILAGAACGLACSTHYYALFLAAPLLLAILFATRAQGAGATLTRVAQAGGAAAFVFFALSPFLAVEPGTAWRDIVANRQIVVDRAVSSQHALFGNLGVYLRMLWSEDLGWPVCIGAAAGAILLLRDRERRQLALVLLAFPVPFLLFISNTVAASRYLNPVMPSCAVLAAYAVVALCSGKTVRIALSPQRQPASVSGLPPAGRRIAASGRGAAFPWLLALLMALPGLVLSLRLDLFFRQPDTRTLGLQFIEQNIAAGSTILVQPYSVPLAQSRASLIEALQAHRIDPAHAPTKFALRLALPRSPNPNASPTYRTLFLGEGGLDQDKIYLSYREAVAADTTDAAHAGGTAGATNPELGALRRAGVQYMVLKRYNAPDPGVEPLRARLAREGRLLTTISPYAAGTDAATRARVAPFLHNTDTPYDAALDRPGPGIEVWQVPP